VIPAAEENEEIAADKVDESETSLVIGGIMALEYTRA